MSVPFSDGHCDFLYGMVNSGYDLNGKALRQAVSLRALKKGNVKLQLFAAWIDMAMKKPAISQFLAMADAYERMLSSNPALVKLSPDFDVEGEKIAAVLTIEGGEAIEGLAENLRCFSRMGVAAMTLTWNTPNELAHPALKKNRKGLTPLGKEIVREMGRIGMAVDVSHLNDAGIDDVLAENVRVFASHSNSRTVFSSPRSLCDEHIREIARRGGTVGVNFYHKQLTSLREATVDNIVDHIEHIAEVGGLRCAAIGSDFDGMGVYPRGLETPAGLPLIAEELQRRGFDQSAIRAICCENLFKLMLDLCQTSGNC